MTCKFCGKHELDSKHDKGREYMLRYGRRGAAAHLVCLASNKGSDFVLGLRTGILESLPYMLVRDLGFEDALRRELHARSMHHPAAQASQRAL